MLEALFYCDIPRCSDVIHCMVKYCIATRHFCPVKCLNNNRVTFSIHVKMFSHELEEFGEVPSNGVLCLLCRQKLIIRRGDLRSFEEHLRRTHAVYNNINWIIESTLHSQKRKGWYNIREGKDYLNVCKIFTQVY